jgi:DNA-binding response OmpR family regulator
MPAKILIIQSDPAVRDLMSLSLTRAGYEVQTKDDLRQALPWLRAEQPDLVLLDLFLRDSVGLDNLYHVRKAMQLQPPAGDPAPAAPARLIVVSALCYREIVQVARKAGACDFLAKPVDPAELVERVHKALERAQGLTEDAPIS